MYGFSGAIPVDVLSDNADCTLRDLEAVGIETVSLLLSPVDSLGAVRTSGYFAAGGLWIWAQHSYFAAKSPVPESSFLIHQSVFVESSQRPALDADVTALSDTMHKAFVGATDSGL